MAHAKAINKDDFNLNIVLQSTYKVCQFQSLVILFVI